MPDGEGREEAGATARKAGIGLLLVFAALAVPVITFFREVLHSAPQKLPVSPVDPTAANPVGSVERLILTVVVIVWVVGRIRE